jgi:hypothetical protein
LYHLSTFKNKLERIIDEEKEKEEEEEEEEKEEEEKKCVNKFLAIVVRCKVFSLEFVKLFLQPCFC